MGIPATGGNLLLGRGNLFFDRWTAAGVKTGWRFLGNVPEFSLNTSDDVREKNSSTEAAAPLLARVVIKRTPEFSIALDEFQLESIALGMMGSAATYSQVNTPVTGEVLVASGAVPLGVVKGNYYKTAKRGISAVTVKKAPSTSLVLGTDYDILDAETGLIYIKPTGVTLSNGDGVNIDYTPRTITNENKIIGATSTIIDGSILFVPDNASGPKLELEVWHVQVAPDGDISFITDDFGQMKIKGSVVSDATLHPTEPYYRLIQRP